MIEDIRILSVASCGRSNFSSGAPNLNRWKLSACLDLLLEILSLYSNPCEVKSFSEKFPKEPQIAKLFFCLCEHPISKKQRVLICKSQNHDLQVSLFGQCWSCVRHQLRQNRHQIFCSRINLFQYFDAN